MTSTLAARLVDILWFGHDTLADANLSDWDRYVTGHGESRRQEAEALRRSGRNSGLCLEVKRSGAPVQRIRHRQHFCACNKNPTAKDAMGFVQLQCQS